MKIKIISLFVICFLYAGISLLAQQSKMDSVAQSMGLKQYFFVMLSKGSNHNQDSVTSAKIQEGHLANIRRLAGLGKLLIAGPFGDNTNWAGIFIFDCATKEEVESLLKTDPAVAAGRLIYDIHPWWTGKNCLFK
jgi:uncharacterized protein YciI